MDTNVIAISQRISDLMNEKNLSYGELSLITEIPKSALHRYATGATPKIPLNRLEKIATAFNVTPAYLMGWEENDIPIASNIMPLPKMKKVPLLGDIACGVPIYAEEEYGEYIETDVQADFCLRAKGNSMIGARILDGDIVFIRKQETVNNGDIAAVLIENDATLKRVYYYPDKGKIILTPENPDFEPIVYIGEELNEIKILGRAVAFQSTLFRK